MTVTSNQSGSQTATIGTEHTLGAAITAAGIYQLVVDVNAMVAGDVLELRIYTKCKTGSTERVELYSCYANTQNELNKRSLPLPIDTSFEATLKQTAGTGRVFDWNILSF